MLHPAGGSLPESVAVPAAAAAGPLAWAGSSPPC